MIITLPIPSAKLSPNARVHWQALRREKKAFGEQVTIACLEQQIPKANWATATVRARFYFPVNRRRDQDNAASRLKQLWDSLVDYGLLADDSGLTISGVELLVDAVNPRLEITIDPEGLTP